MFLGSVVFDAPCECFEPDEGTTEGQATPCRARGCSKIAENPKRCKREGNAWEGMGVRRRRGGEGKRGNIEGAVCAVDFVAAEYMATGIRIVYVFSIFDVCRRR